MRIIIRKMVFACLVSAVMLIGSGCSIEETTAESVVVKYEKSSALIMAEEKEKNVDNFIEATIEGEMTNQEIITKYNELLKKKAELSEAVQTLNEIRELAKEALNYKIPELEKARNEWREKSSEYCSAKNELYALCMQVK